MEAGTRPEAEGEDAFLEDQSRFEEFQRRHIPD